MSLEAIANLNACMDSVDALLAGLNDDQWAVQSYCPDWDVRGVAMHLAAVEHMLIGDEPGSWTDSVPFDKVGAYMMMDMAHIAERRRVERVGGGGGDATDVCRVVRRPPAGRARRLG